MSSRDSIRSIYAAIHFAAFLLDRGLSASPGRGTVGCWMEDTAGGRDLTIHLATREARYHGVTVLGPAEMDPRYRGRGWRERMAEDCAEWLRRAR